MEFCLHYALKLRLRANPVKRSELLPELVGRQLHRDAPDIPQTANDKLAENEAKEERDGAPEPLKAAVAKQDQLQDPGDEQRHPDQVDLPATGHGVAQRVEWPPREAYPHRL